MLMVIFVYIGMVPNTDLYKSYINLDERGYVIADENTKTNVERSFAAGDVRTKQFRQLVAANSDGAIAALSAEKYISQKKRRGKQ